MTRTKSTYSAGSLPQLAPTPSTRGPIWRATISGETPIMVRPWVSKVKVQMMGRSVARRAPSMAALASPRSLMVSMSSRSAPPWARPWPVRHRRSAASSGVTVAQRFEELARGPHVAHDEYLTTSGRRELFRATSRASSAARRLISITRSASRGLPDGSGCRQRCRSGSGPIQLRCSPGAGRGSRPAAPGPGLGDRWLRSIHMLQHGACGAVGQ